MEIDLLEFKLDMNEAVNNFFMDPTANFEVDEEMENEKIREPIKETKGVISEDPYNLGHLPIINNITPNNPFFSNGNDKNQFKQGDHNSKLANLFKK